MFRNIAYTLKHLAVILFFACLILGVSGLALSLYIYPQGIPASLIIILSCILSFPLYGLGELIESVHTQEDILKDILKKLRENDLETTDDDEDI